MGRELRARRGDRRARARAPAPHNLTVAYAPGQGKQVRLDGVEVASLDELRRQGAVFIFVPESLLLVKGSPARRRAHLDAFAAALDPAYDGRLARPARRTEATQRPALARTRGRRRRLARRLGPPARARRADLRASPARRSWRASRRATAGSPRALAPGGGDFAALVSQLDGSVDEVARRTAASGARGRVQPAGARARRGLRRGAAGARGRRDRARRLGFGPHRDDLASPGGRGRAGRRRGGARPAALRLAGRAARRRARPAAGRAGLAAGVTGDLGTLLLDDVMSELDDARRRLLVGTLSAGGQAHHHDDQPALLH